MSRAVQFSATALAAALLLTGCGGGGTSPAQPAAAPHPTAAPAANRTAVGTATLVLKLPQVLTAKNGKAVAAKGANARHAQYVDPIPAPTPTSTSSPGTNAPTNLIDIYVDGSLISNIDNLAGTWDSSVEVTSSTGTQSITLPLFSTSSNVIVAAEFDGTHSNLLAIGEANLGTFTAGSANNISLTMQMNAQSLGIVDFPAESAPTVMSLGNGPFGSAIYSCPGSPVQFGVYTADALGAFVPQGGYGGTGLVSVTGASDNAGLTSVSQPQSAFPGVYTVTFDGSCDGILLAASSSNPAYAIYSDIQSSSPNYATYAHGNGGNSINSPNQGIYNLYNSVTANSYSSQTFTASLNQASNPLVTGHIELENGTGT